MITDLEHRLLMTKTNIVKDYAIQLEGALRWIVEFVELGDEDSRPVELVEWLAAVKLMLEEK